MYLLLFLLFIIILFIIYFHLIDSDNFENTNVIIDITDISKFTIYNKNICFIYICDIIIDGINKSQDILIDQINYIKNSNLYTILDYIFITVSCDFIDLTDDLKDDSKIKFIYYAKNNNEAKLFHLNSIKIFTDNITDNINILQINNTELSYKKRKYLEYFLIEKYELCIEALKNYNFVGVNMQYDFDNHTSYYYCNSWWAQSNYIKNLNKIDNDNFLLTYNLFKNDYRFFLSLHHTDIDKDNLDIQQYNIDIIKNNILKQIKNNFIKDRPIYGIFFICCLHNYYEIILEQINELISSNLYLYTDTIYCFLCKQTKECIDLLSNYSKIKIIATDENLYEKYAINNIKNYLSGNYYIYYIHSKAITRNTDSYNDWRILLNYFTITKWRLSVELLKYYDTVGVNLKSFPTKHYSGNFWWSKSEHINKLKNIGDKYYSSEMYILSYAKTNYIAIYNSNMNHNVTNYPITLYNSINDEQLINNIIILPIINIEDTNKNILDMIDINKDLPIIYIYNT